MTVTNTTNTVEEAGNGSKTAFTFSFKAQATTDIQVFKVNTSTLVATLQIEGSGADYTVALNDTTEGGTVTYTVAPTTSENSFIKRLMTLDQQTDVPTEGNIPEIALNNEFDKSRMIDIQQQEELARSLHFAETSSLSDVEVPEGTSASDRAGKVLAYDSTGTAMQLLNPTSVVGTDPIAVKGDIVQGDSAGDAEKLAISSNQWDILTVGSNGKLTYGNPFDIVMRKGSDVASAAALPVLTDGNAANVTGTTTITSINSVGVGSIKVLKFDGALTLTHHATNLILPAGNNITTVAGDVHVFYEYASGDWVWLAGSQSQGAATGVVQIAYTDKTPNDSGTSGAVAFGSTTMNFDDTTPQITEGTEFMTKAITPKASTNRLLIRVVAFLTNDSAAENLQMALFNTDFHATNAIKSTYQRSNTANTGGVLVLEHDIVASDLNGTTETTFSLRAGAGGGNTTINGNNELQIFNNTAASSITIMEYVP